MSRPLWFNELIKKIFPARFLIAKSSKLPVFGNMIYHWLFEGDDLVYLPANQVIPVNEPVGGTEKLILPSQVVDHVIEKANVHWVMNSCICRDANQCKDYPIDFGCLFLGDAALGINPELGRRITKEEALQYVQRCREAGLVHMIGRNKLDTVWLGVTPGIKLLTICNCCPCCCIWGILPDVTHQIGATVGRMPGLKVLINDQCIACGICLEDVCFVDAISISDGRYSIDDACRGCGRCVSVCPVEAIEIVVQDDHFVETTISRILSLADLS
ncbi:MAG: 4Fe-4S ferredoxin [Chloroflexi bacterium RBG_16_48_8]|nr:MAG: 4Fe-4S ferredoxin [Chloroflexi bacterium RBG_16_48_8]